MKEYIDKALKTVEALYGKVSERVLWAVDIYKNMLTDYKANKEKSAAKPIALVTALGYFLLIFVVIYGAKDHVYDGFGVLAPWLVGGIFLTMSVLRAKQFCESFKLFADKKDKKEIGE